MARIWKLGVFVWKILLKTEGVFDHINSKPPGLRNPTETWLKDNACAMHLMITNIHDNYLGTVRGSTTAYAMYQSLMTSFRREKDLQVADLRDELYKMSYSKSSKETLAEYITRFKTIAGQLKESGDQTPANQFMLRLLRSLPADFQPIRTLLQKSMESEDSETTFSVTSQILNFEKDIAQDNGGKNSEVKSDVRPNVEPKGSEFTKESTVMMTSNEAGCGRGNFH